MYNIVEKLLEEFILTEELRSNLYEVYDLERLCGRISIGNANARDLIQLKNSVSVLPKIKEILTQLKFDKKIDTFELDITLYRDDLSIDENALSKANSSNIPFDIKSETIAETSAINTKVLSNP